MNRIRNTQSGFTLFEMVVYVSLLVVVMIVVIQAIIVMMRSFADLRVARDVDQSATTAMEAIVDQLRSANSVDVGGSVLNSSNGDLVLNALDDVGNPTTIEFFLTGGAVHEKEGGVDMGTLVASNVTVPSLVFSTISTPHSTAVRVQMELTATRGSITQTRTFYDTIVIRGSYSS